MNPVIDSGQQSDSATACIEDMCVHRRHPAAKTEENDEPPRIKSSFQQVSATPDDRFCDESMPSNERLLVVPIVPAYHASTALEQLLMSSPQVTTLCSAGTWQCEGRWIL